MNTILATTGWGIPKEYSVERLPGLPQSERRCLDKLNELARQYPDKLRKRQGTKAIEFHFSVLPQSAQVELIKKYPKIVVKDEFNSSSKVDPISNKDEYLWDYYSRKTDDAKSRAIIKFNAVKMFHLLRSNGWKKTDAKEAVVDQFKSQTKISFHTLGQWISRVEGIDTSNWLPMLVDNRSGRLAKAEVSPEAWDFIKADYLRLRQPTWASCYERLTRAAEANNWSVPSSKTLFRKLEREIPSDLITLLREGEDAYKRTELSQERDRSVFHAMEAVNGDGYTFSRQVQFESGEVCQPTCWFWQDIYSGKLLAWRLDVSENKDMIRLSIGDLIERYGIPSHFLDRQYQGCRQ